MAHYMYVLSCSMSTRNQYPGCGSEARKHAVPDRFLKNLLGTPKGAGAKEAKYLVAGATTYLGAHCVRGADL